MDKAAAEAFAPVVIDALRKYTKIVLTDLNEDQKKDMHPQALAALTTLSNIKGEFCHVAPQVVATIDGAGLIMKMFLGGYYALLLAFRALITQMQAALCPTTPSQ